MEELVKEVNEAPEVPKKEPLVNFLTPGKVINITPLAAAAKWSELVVGDIGTDEPFMYGDTGIGMSAPLDRSMGGTIKRVLDNVKRVETVQYPGEMLTEEQFFERILDRDLSLSKKVDNFWKKDPIAVFEIDRDGLTLNMGNPEHVLRYKILLANKRKVAGPDVTSKLLKAKNFLFKVVDNDAAEEAKEKKRNIKKEAQKLYYKYEDDKKMLRNILFIANKGQVKNPSLEWLQNQVWDFVEDDPRRFLDVVEDKNFHDKVFIAKARYIGELVVNGEQYMLANGAPIGDLIDTINFFRNPEHDIQKNQIQARIENSREFE